MKNDTQFSKKLNTTEKKQLDKVLDQMMIEEKIKITDIFDKRIEKETELFLKSQKEANKLVRTIAQSWEKLNILMKNTRLTTNNHEEKLILAYNDYRYSDEKADPKIEKVLNDKEIKLDKFNEIQRELKMRLWSGDVTYNEMKKMIKEKLATL
jgi:hypothetical protein